MILILIATVLILGIAFFQVVQGLFSSLIMTILTVLSATVAFNYYELLAETLLYTRQPATADAIALVATFLVPLLCMRLLLDKYMAGNVVMNVWADRIGGGVLGVITGMIMVGVLMIAAQMLPFGDSVLMYRGFDDTLRRDQGLAPFYPDEFTAGLMGVLSDGSLKGENRFEKVHDDLLLEVFCARNTAGKGGRIDAMPDSLRVLGVYRVERNAALWLDDVPASPFIDRTKPTKIIVVRVEVNDSAIGEHNWWRLPATHFRMTTDAGRSHYPLGYLTYMRNERPKWACHTPPITDGLGQIAKLIVERGRDKRRSVTIDWIYRVEMEENPAEMIFRRAAKATLPKAKTSPPPAADGILDRTKGDRRRRR